MSDILVFSAHPDDAEFGMGATLCKLADQGHSITHCVLTLGDAGTYGTPQIRKQELEAACELIDAELILLNYQDCHIKDDIELRVRLAEIIRKVKPKIVFTTPWDLKGSHQEGRAHPDHIELGSATRFATRLARFKGLKAVKGEAHKISSLLYYMDFDSSEVFIDVSNYKEQFIELIEKHKTQMSIKDGRAKQFLIERREQLGRKCGVEFAEGFSSPDAKPLDYQKYLK